LIWNLKFLWLASLFFTLSRVVLRTFLNFWGLLVINIISKQALIIFFLVINFCRDAYSFYIIIRNFYNSYEETYNGMIKKLRRLLSHLLYSSQDCEIKFESDLINAAYFIMSFGSCNWDYHTSANNASYSSNTNHWIKRFSTNDKED
jgi:hypothetical protein